MIGKVFVYTLYIYCLIDVCICDAESGTEAPETQPLIDDLIDDVTETSEANTYFISECKENQFACSGIEKYCIPINWKCDQDRDCPDGSDESATACPSSQNPIASKMNASTLYLNRFVYLLFLFVPTNLGSSDESIITTTSTARGGKSSNESSQKTKRNSNNENISISIDGRPYFDLSVSKNLTVIVGQTAYLNCRVHNLGNKTVSWIRHKDINLLSSGRNLYSSDQRFQIVHNPETEEWTLHIKYLQSRDSGSYECQISTTPPVGHVLFLSVVEPVTTIVGSPDLYINTGSTVNLTCIVQNLPEPPPFITWHHNTQVISYDSPRGGVSVITEKGDITISNLLIQRARPTDSGKYSCSPTNANTEVINVHILNGEHPEAMQHGGQLKISDPIYILFISILCFIIGR